MAAKSGGKRAGARRGVRPKRRLRPNVLAYAVAVTVLVIGWGYLVWVAIDFGGHARDGDTRAWAFLAMAALGAVACLFAGLMVAAKLFRTLTALPHPTPRAHESGTSFAPESVGSLDGNTVFGPRGEPASVRTSDPDGPARLRERGAHNGSHRHRAD